ncbi:MAG: glutamine synthetase family protein, partial [Mycobacterium sp.]
GDERVRIDLSALRIIDDGLAWAPAAFFEQDGTPAAVCSRGTLSRVEAALAEAGIEAMIGHEMEFVLVDPDGGRLPSTLWAQYGLAGVLEHEGFVRDITRAAARSGVAIEQLHPEYAANQFEISLAPLAPVAAADQLVLTRIIVGRAARRHGLRVSLSPVPFAGSVGSGAHQHFSLTTSEGPVFCGGTGAADMTAAGESAVAGLIRGLPEAQGVLCGSIVSGLRMQPGNWAGAYACWGTENREAAVRFIKGGPGTPQGANVEVKVIDPSANPYFASATILGLALDGIRHKVALPAETTTDPAKLSNSDRERAGILRLPGTQPEVIAALDNSELVRHILGDAGVDMVVAVRRHEQQFYGELGAEQLVDKFRMAWSL